MNNKFTIEELSKKSGLSINLLEKYIKKGVLSSIKSVQDNEFYFLNDELLKTYFISIYMDLDLDYDEICLKIKNKHNYDIFEDILRPIKENIEYDLDKSLTIKLRLDKLIERIYKTGKIDESYVKEIHRFVKKTNEEKKDEMYVFKCVLAISYILFIVAGTILSVAIGNFSYILFIAIAIMLILSYLYYHKETTTYECPKCKSKFKLSLRQEILAKYSFKKGKKVKCIKCKQKFYSKVR